MQRYYEKRFNFLYHFELCNLISRSASRKQNSWWHPSSKGERNSESDPQNRCSQLNFKDYMNACDHGVNPELFWRGHSVKGALTTFSSWLMLYYHYAAVERQFRLDRRSSSLWELFMEVLHMQHDEVHDAHPSIDQILLHRKRGATLPAGAPDQLQSGEGGNC